MRIILTILCLAISYSSMAQNQNVSLGNVFDGEPYLAVNPNNSKHIVVAWMGWVNFSQQFKIKVRSSFDGGVSWSNTVELPHTVTGYTSADPSIAFNSSGDVFVCYIDFTGTTPPSTGGVFLIKSTDGGRSFGNPKEVISTNYDGDKWPIDRPWLVIDKSSHSTKDNIYVTSMNLNREKPSFNPYLSVSVDGGESFTKRYVDSVGWLAGSINPLPMASPSLASDGTLFVTYPSYVISQSVYPQLFLARSTNGGAGFSYQIVSTIRDVSSAGDYADAKKAGLLIVDPSDVNHLATFSLRAIHDELDVFLIESFDAGKTWSTPIRVNDDPIGNNRMQDLIWADFDADGDLIVSWRDRRNGSDSTFSTPSEIWAAFRKKDSSDFSPNFQITNKKVDYDSILTRAGNDFMCVKLVNDTLHASWGDTRDGRLNIWYQSMSIEGELLSTVKLATENTLKVQVFPNPVVGEIIINGKSFESIKVFNMEGKLVLSQVYKTQKKSVTIDMSYLPSGKYIIEVLGQTGKYTEKIIKK